MLGKSDSTDRLVAASLDGTYSNQFGWQYWNWVQQGLYQVNLKAMGQLEAEQDKELGFTKGVTSWIVDRFRFKSELTTVANADRPQIEDVFQKSKRLRVKVEKLPGLSNPYQALSASYHP